MCVCVCVCCNSVVKHQGLMFVHRALLFKQEKTSSEAFLNNLLSKSDVQKMFIQFTP